MTLKRWHLVSQELKQRRIAYNLTKVTEPKVFKIADGQSVHTVFFAEFSVPVIGKVRFSILDSMDAFTPPLIGLKHIEGKRCLIDIDNRQAVINGRTLQFRNEVGVPIIPLFRAPENEILKIDSMQAYVSDELSKLLTNDIVSIAGNDIEF